MPSISDFAVNMASGSKDVPWFNKTPPELSAAARELLENYSHIPSDQVNLHVFEIREKAWSVWPYPCIGTARRIEQFSSLVLLTGSRTIPFPRPLHLLASLLSTHPFGAQSAPVTVHPPRPRLLFRPGYPETRV